MSSPFSAPLTRLFLLLFIAGGVVWLGGTVIRAAVGFDVFVPGTLVFKPEQPEIVRLHTIRLFALAGAWTNWSFAVCAVGAIGLMILTRSLFRQRGWLLMCAILLVLILPVQGYLIWDDIRLIQLFDRNIGTPLAGVGEIFGVFLQRYTNLALNMMAALSFMAAATIVFLATLRPLHRN